MDSRREELAHAVPGDAHRRLIQLADAVRRPGVTGCAYDHDIMSDSFRMSDPFRPVHHNLPFYGFDIETDTSADGLDPKVAPVAAAALVGEDFQDVFDGKETDLLTDLDHRLAELEPGVLVTWNGGCFDLPFLRDRAAICGVTLGLRLVLDPQFPGGRQRSQNHADGYRARWHEHGHLDAYQVFRADVGACIGLSCALKRLARFVGLEVVEVDRQRIHELSDDERRAYAISDAHLARALIRRRARPWAGIDQLPLSISS
ncbi:MAG: hypothetical protein OXF75_07650 [Acidimicrobiaceae bacterium]|nr:hypothetical protein [Acidimicrobiaceae bacterium]